MHHETQSQLKRLQETASLNSKPKSQPSTPNPLIRASKTLNLREPALSRNFQKISQQEINFEEIENKDSVLKDKTESFSKNDELFKKLHEASIEMEVRNESQIFTSGEQSRNSQRRRVVQSQKELSGSNQNLKERLKEKLNSSSRFLYSRIDKIYQGNFAENSLKESIPATGDFIFLFGMWFWNSKIWYFHLCLYLYKDYVLER